MRRQRITGRCGQSLVEYAVLTGVVAAAVVGMNVYVMRGVNANLQNLQEEINASVDDTNQTTPPETPTNPAPNQGGPTDPNNGNGPDPIVF